MLDTLDKKSSASLLEKLKAAQKAVEEKIKESEASAAKTENVMIGSVTQPQVVTMEDISKSIIGNQQVQDALAKVADIFHKSNYAAMISKGLASLDTEVLEKSRATLGNVGIGMDTRNAPDAVAQAAKQAKEALEAAGGGKGIKS